MDCEPMSANPLELKFGTALFLFRDVEQMTVFLGEHCFRDKQGKVWLHHGCNYHEFTKLAAGYYVNIPDGVKWKNRRRTNFMLGQMDNVTDTEI